MGPLGDPLGSLWDSWKSFRVAGPQMARILIKKRQCRARFFKIPTFRSPEWSSKKSLRGSLERWNSGDRKVGILKNRALHCRFLIKIRARRREGREGFPKGPPRTVYSIQYTVQYTVYCTVYCTVYSILYSILYTVYCPWWALGKSFAALASPGPNFDQETTV